MRKFATLLSMLMLFCSLAFTQNLRKITGLVRSDEGPVSFATATETGTRNAVNADANGNFTITITSNQLTITAVGFESQTVTLTGNSILVTLLLKQGEMQEVIVNTAFGVKRRPRELGYAQTTLTNQQITVGKSPNLGAALSGKVAGLTVLNTSNSVDAVPLLTFRGVRSLTGNNQAMVVLDGVFVPLNTINYLNPEDVESVTFLKGSQATVLYGSDGINGALVVTTKKGSGKPQVTLSSSVNFEELAYLPKFQTTHGSGSGYGYTPQENFRPYENQQYGDHYDGSIRSVGRVTENGNHLDLPYQFIPGIRKKVWDRGLTTQNNISVSGGDINSSFFISFQDANTAGIVPKDKYRRNTFRLNASRTYGKFKASFETTYSLDHTQRTTSDFYYYALNTPGWIPIDQLKDWKTNEFASPNGYFNDYYENPWFVLDNNRSEGRNTYFNGNLTLDFKPLTWLDLTYRVGTAVTNGFEKSWAGRFNFSDWAKFHAYTFDPRYNDYDGIFRAGTDVLGYVSDFGSTGNRITSDFLATLNKDWGELSTKLILGNSIIARRTKSLNVGSTSVIIPEVYNVSNRSGELIGGESNSNQRKVGFFGDLTAGFKDFIFFHLPVRLDVTSLFYDGIRKFNSYSFWYYGGDVSFLVTQAFPSLRSDVLSYLKLRGGWNTNGNDNLSPYELKLTYGNGPGFPYGTVVGTTVGNTVPDPGLKPEKTKTAEIGFELSLWKNRINIDATAYRQNATGQILAVSLSSSTGYTTTKLNAADVVNRGAEVELRANVFRKNDWLIDVNANYTYNKNEVKSLFGDLTRIEVNSYYGRSAFVYAEIGQQFPLLKTTQWMRDPNGQIVIDPADGWPIVSPDQKAHGPTIPVHQFGIGTRVSFKGFTLAANAEYRGGNYIFHGIGEDLAFTGSGKITTTYNRETFIWPNSVYWDGSKYVPNTNIPVENFTAIYRGWGDYGFSRGIIYNGEVFTTSAAFWKLRDVSLGYEMPQRWLQKWKFVKGVGISVFGRNLVTLLPNENIYTDPEFSTGAGLNSSFNTPPVRQYGVTMNLNF